MFRLCALFVAMVVVMPIAFADSFYIAPFLQNVSPDGVTVIYQTNENGQGVVEYGPEGKFDQKATGAADEMIRKVRITGLKPDTAYSYRVRVGDEVKEHVFKTAPLPSADREVTFAIFGDTRRWENRVEETGFIKSLMEWKPEFFLINGDLVVKGHDYSLWKPHFDRFAEIGATHMVLTARGNHEGSMLTDKENDWFAKYHDNPNGEPYSHFTWGNVHVVALAWEQTVNPAMVKPTADWLDTHLGDAKSPYTFVSQHFPIYCTGYAGPADNRKQPGDDMLLFKNVLDKHNVTAHMAGHTHIFERHYPIRDNKRDDRNGVHYLVNGGDINANYGEWWTAYTDNGSGYSKPTYTIYQCKKDRMDIRTFAWSEEQKKFVQIDRDIAWKDEATPKSVLTSLDSLKGAEQLDAIEALGAMLYEPAIPSLAKILKSEDLAACQKAAWAISMIGTKESIMALQTYLDDKDPEVRYQAARAFEVAMPEAMGKDIAKRAADDSQDPRVRVKLIGALQLHGDPKLTRETLMGIVESKAPDAVRERAAYGLTRVVGEKDVKPLLKAIDRESNSYVTARLAFTLNKLTGFTQNAEQFGKTQPGERGEFIKKWEEAPKDGVKKTAAASQ
ncbi:MAG: HEAT repeat domain-containing protein [Candidatus Hydrogenedentes bacterium]|nr:HEAT repeat domain-containing protein [Candidatus Hydrogenedentota bacterium]